MPTENERKIVITSVCESQISELSKRHYLIHQGYLIVSRGTSLRLRKTQSGKVASNDLSFQCYGDIRHNLTFKSAVNGGSRVVEIEKKIDNRDFNDLWPQCLNKLIKHRFLVKNNDEIWEIDFFKDHYDKTYFALAEIELPEGKKEPKSVPDFIKSNLLYKVPLTDSRFSSKLLADIRYATTLLKEFI